jgi:hypothetical protein
VTHPISLAVGAMLDAGPPDVVSIAAAAGFDAAGG